MIKVNLLLLMSAICAFGAESYLSPTDLDWDGEGEHLFITTASGQQVLVFDVVSRSVVRRIPLPTDLTGAVVSPDGTTLYVTGGGVEGRVFVVDATSGKIKQTIPVGHTPMAPNLSLDGKTLYVCNRFDNDVSFIDLVTGKTTARIPAVHEPVAADLTPDGTTLFVANLLPDGPANVDYVACKVTVIHTETQTVTTIPLVNGAEGVRGLRVSPDGQYVFLTSIMARFLVPATQLERGWVSTDALSVIRVADLSLYHTVLLDEVDRGFPNPWPIAFSEDGRTLIVGAAGTHELSLIDLPAMLKKIATQQTETPSAVGEVHLDAHNDLAFLSGIRKRITLKGNGPRALAVKGGTAYAAHYYSDSIDCVDIKNLDTVTVTPVELNPGMRLTQVRQGEVFFNDATECFQNWLSCATCHPDARTDAMNWDLLNDGMGNPKNVKSMLLAHATPPTTWLGIRPNAEVSVRSGFKHIQFAVRPEEDALAIDAYLKSLEPVPSPYLVDGALSNSARRGEKIFEQAGCIRCHPAPLFTDLNRYELGTTRGRDEGLPVDVPSLIEVWRTAPYMHDGRAATMHDVLNSVGHTEILKQTEKLSVKEINDLIEYILSL